MKIEAIDVAQAGWQSFRKLSRVKCMGESSGIRAKSIVWNNQSEKKGEALTELCLWNWPNPGGKRKKWGGETVIGEPVQNRK